MKRKVVFVTSHPIQYQVPVFRHLAEMPDIDLEVFFAMIPDEQSQGSGFGVAFEWDLPLLEGYRYRTLNNVAAAPSVTRFSGCDTPRIKEVLKETRPDVVIINGWVVKSCLQALWACKQLHVPCLVRGEANDLRHRAWWKKKLQGVLVRRYDVCLYIGQASKAFYLARGVPEDRLFPSPYCVENERFERMAHQLSGERNRLRQEMDIPVDAVSFLSCGKFEGKKHPFELLQAFRQACDANNGLHLLMVGDGELRPKCEAYARQHQLPVTFTGFLNQSEIIQAYVAADCLVLPSDAGETWGLVVNEAMACGKPALVSDLVGCAGDLVFPGSTGDVFQFGDWAALSEMLRHHGHSLPSLKLMGDKARSTVSNYSSFIAAKGIRDAVIDVMNRRAGNTT